MEGFAAGSLRVSMNLFWRSILCVILCLGLAACAGAGAATSSQNTIVAPSAAPLAEPTTVTSATAVAQVESSAAPTTAALPSLTPAVAFSAVPEPPAEPTVTPENATLVLTKIVEGLAQPTFVTHAGDGSGRLFVTERAGRIRIVVNGQLAADPFLDITDRVGSSSTEQGLLSVVFHPQYRSNGFFFVDYTDKDGNTVVARYRVSSNPDRGDPSSETKILGVEQPYPNHNGGQLAFDRNGYLYIGMGDGGGAGDPHGNGQRRDVLLGKLLRIDVDKRLPYEIPADNPFAGKEGFRPEIWALGLRNPWRFSFDRQTGDLFIADVGQGEYEEVDLEPAGSGGGRNYGWNTLEGAHCFEPASGCDQTGTVPPITEYSHDAGCSITGGYRYRGRLAPAFAGRYFFGDYCSGRIWSLHQAGSDEWIKTELLQTSYNMSSFGEDEAGEIYLVTLDGGLYRLGQADGTG